MTMKGIFGAAVMSCMVALSAASVDAAELKGPADEASNEIVVVNDYTSTVGVYVEDADGSVHRLGRVSRGQVKHFQTPEGDDFRVRIRPIGPYVGSDQVEIKSQALNVEADETVIMWLKSELSQAGVELRTS